MKRSFGGLGGGGLNGGSGSGGGGLRTLGRAVKTGIGGTQQDPFSTSSTTSSRPTFRPTSSNPNLSLSYNNSIGYSNQISTTLPIWSNGYCDEHEWVCVDDNDDDDSSVNGSFDDFVFGSVPSQDEVQTAVFALQEVLDPATYSQFIKDNYASNSENNVADQVTSLTSLIRRVSSAESELDWIEPSLQLCYPRTSSPYGPNRVYDAFHLLQTDPSIQRMVVSLSSDRAVWEAVSNNDVVRELRRSFNAGENDTAPYSDKSPDHSGAATGILRWLFDNTKAKFMEIVQKITKLVNELFQDTNNGGEGDSDPFEEKLRSSFFLTIIVLLIVVATRAHVA